ncbi:MAG: lipopolysaccharide biosynthesis protein [Betaproteobacteria bacterium]
MAIRMPGRDPRIMRVCFRPNAEDLSGRVVRGAAWMGTLIVARAVLTVGSTAILARLLTPTDYGYVAMATVVTELAAMLCVFGLPAILVQQQHVRRLDLDSGFWLSVFLGVMIVSLLIAGSAVTADLFREPRLAPILWAMSSLILFEEVSAIHQSIVYRLLLFRYEFICQLANLLVRIAVSISLALAGFGVWSLVWATVAGRATQFVLVWYLIPYVPRFRFNMDFIRRNLRTGGSYFGSAALNFIASSVDTATVGRAFGAAQLGYYQTGLALPEELRSRMAAAMQRVLFPAYSMVQSDHSAFQYGVLKSLRLLAAIAMPMGVGMAALADPIVRTLYGDQWLPVVPLLQILAIVGIMRALQALLSNIYRAKGRPDLDFKIGLWLTPLLVLAVLIGSRWGTAGVAVGVLLFNVAHFASTYRALRLIELDPRKTLAQLLPAAGAAVFMGAALFALDAMRLVPRSTVLVELIEQVAIGAMLFFAALFTISRSTIDELWSVWRLLRARN